MITSVQIQVRDGFDSSYSTLDQAPNEPFDTFISRIRYTIEIHQGAMRDIIKKQKVDEV